jgi:hypothetical protein
VKRLVFLSLSLLLLILIPGCITVPAPLPNPTPPVIIEFSNSPSTINSGGTSTLLWNVTGADSVSIDQGIGQVNAAGTRVVSPATSTVYTISASNSAGTVTRSSLTTVNSVLLTPPVIIEFSNNPATINSGGTSILLWNVTGATSVSIDQGIGLVGAAGTRVVSPLTSTVYTISATNSAGTVTRSAVTTVNSAQLPPQTSNSNPVISFTATYIGANQWQLNWNVSNATQISIEPDIGTLNQNFNPQGSHIVTITSGQTKTYRLKAINNWGWAYWDVMLTSP